MKTRILAYFMQCMIRIVIGRCNANVYVRHFSCARVRCFKDYKKPSLKEVSDHSVFFVGTNDLDSEHQPDLIAESMANVAATLKSEKHEVTISNIMIRNSRFETKANKVNEPLRKMCYERNFFLIDNLKTLKQKYLN